MSWFTDIAGKAENLLNKFDQNAASVLKQNPNFIDDYTTTTPSSDSLIESTNLNGMESFTINNQQINKIKSTIESASPIKNSIIKSLSTSSLLLLKSNDILSNSKKLEETELQQHQQKSTSNSRHSSISSKSSKIGGDGGTGSGTVIERLSPPINHSNLINNSGNSSMTTSDIIINDGTATSSSNINSMQNELIAAKIVLNEIKSERDELKCEVNSLREHLNNECSQSIIKDFQETCAQLLNERTQLTEKINILEKSNTNYIRSISELEIKLSKMLQNDSELNVKYEWLKKEADQAIDELQQYRTKAQKTLQMKEHLINKLKNQNSNYSSMSNINNQSENDDQPKDATEIDHLKLDNRNLTTERNLFAQQLNDIRMYVVKLEEMHKNAQIEFEMKLNMINQNAQQDERKLLQYESDYKIQLKELNAVRDELTRIQMDSATKLQDKDHEINQLKKKCAQKYQKINISGSGISDLEERVQSLTQSLVQKQNSLETITADRNALRFQMEKMEHQHRNTIVQLRQQRSQQHQQEQQQIINVNDTDDAKAQLPIFMQENPFDTGVARRVKRAYSSLDSLGIHFGIFLRRYPLMRILAIFYVAILHLWVMLVLFTSRPI